MKLTKILYWTFWAVLALNIATLFFVPKIVTLGLNYPRAGADRELGRNLQLAFGIGFFETCGVCTAFILWQAKGVLKNLTRGLAFVVENARYVYRASWACFIIAAAAFARMLLHIGRYTVWTGVLFEYNTLFIPIAAVAGLLCLVVSNLFYSAATLKQDNDLVI